MKLEQKNLLTTLFESLTDVDDLFKKNVSYTIEQTQDSGWEIVLEEKAFNELGIYITFVNIAQIIKTCEQIFSANNEMLTYGFQLTEKDNEIIVRYVIF